jgi:Rha family phage regulatory protein
MDELKVISVDGQLVTDSREVAKMVGKRHTELLRTIKGYEGILAERNFASGDFFIESAYKDGNNQTRLCYLLTKKGCEMVANKMTGEKGVLFTAAYVTKFDEMEKQLDTSQLSPELQMFNGLFRALAKQELETKKLAGEVQGIRDVVALNTVDWREDSRNLISKIAQSRGGFGAYREVNSEIYKEVERRGKFDLSRRLTNKRRRLADEGVSKSKRDKLTKVDVIADDKRLIEIYIAVVKEFAIKHGVKVD